MVNSLPCHRGQAEPEASGKPAEARAVVLHHKQRPPMLPGNLDGHRAGRARRARRIGEQVRSHKAQGDRMQQGEYRLGGPYQGQLTRPRHSLSGYRLVDNPDNVGMIGVRLADLRHL